MKKILSFVIAMAILLCGNFINVYALTNSDVLPDSEVVEEFDVYIPDKNIFKKNRIETKSHIIYKVEKLGVTSEIGDYTGQAASAQPGMSIELSNMSSTTFSASSNVAWNVKGKAEAALGFSFSKSQTIGHSGSVKIPSTHNGRKVKRAEIRAYRLYDKYNFKVTWTSIYVRKPQYYGTYWAKKPCGYHYKTIYYYK